jgi:hypothetical protein
MPDMGDAIRIVDWRRDEKSVLWHKIRARFLYSREIAHFFKGEK